MANKRLFQSAPAGQAAPKTDTINEAGGRAYSRTDRGTLAQYAATGCLNSTFYSRDEDQLKIVLDLSKKVDSEFLAKLAIYTREQGYMKDMPALLVSVLFSRMKTDPKARFCFYAAFGRCIDSGNSCLTVYLVGG